MTITAPDEARGIALAIAAGKDPYEIVSLANHYDEDGCHIEVPMWAAFLIAESDHHENQR